MADSSSPAFQPPINTVYDKDPPDIISVGKKEDVEIGGRMSAQKGLMQNNPFGVRNVPNGK